MDDEGQNGLETEPRGVHPAKQTVGPTDSGPLCASPTNQLSRFLSCMETNVRANQTLSYRTLQNPIQSTSSENDCSPGHANMENTGVVPHSLGDAGGLSHYITSSGQSDTTDYTTNGIRGRTSTSRLAYLWQQYRDKQISSIGTLSCYTGHGGQSRPNRTTRFLKMGVLVSLKGCRSHFGPYR